ncbi:NAD(P)-binding protein [Hypoxylon sp. FL1284]|nr:NAD(P)-binding protein [Hypoxylon sp. FL1284]
MAPIGIAIIGGGIFVKEQHIPAALASPLLSIKALWSRSLKTAEEAAKLIPADAGPVDLYSTDSGEGKSYDDILKRDDIAGLILALPIVDQPDYIEKALAAGKHVLSEKPVAKDVATAGDLVLRAHETEARTGASWAVAENFRFVATYAHAAAEVRSLGRVTGFVVRVNFRLEPTDKYFQTAWRAAPAHQGGFLLDAGVHFTAALRRVLGPDNAVESVVALTSRATDYLPAVDSVNAVLKTKSGAVGSFVNSAGSLDRVFEYSVACEGGVVRAEPAKVTTVRGAGKDAVTEEKTFEPGFAVKEEVQAWAEAVQSGVPNPEQTPEKALGDLELLESMLTSGEWGGKAQTLQFQRFV